MTRLWLFLVLLPSIGLANRFTSISLGQRGVTSSIRAWQPSTSYVEDDLVYGSLISIDIYVAISNFTSVSTEFSDDFEIIGRWETLSPESIGTGPATGGLITQNSTTTIDIENGRGAILNLYDQLDRKREVVNWVDFTNLTPAAPQFGVTSVYIDSTGTPLFTPGPPDLVQIKDNIFLGRIIYDEDNTTIRGVFSQRPFPRDTNSQGRDHQAQVGTINFPDGGNVYFCRTTLLDITKTAGNLINVGFNFADLREPNTAETPAQVPVILTYALQDELIDAASMSA